MGPTTPLRSRKDRWRRPAQSCLSRAGGRRRKSDADSTNGENGGQKVGREERYRTVISGMEPRRIAVVMLLPRTGASMPHQRYCMPAWVSILAVRVGSAQFQTES